LKPVSLVNIIKKEILIFIQEFERDNMKKIGDLRKVLASGIVIPAHPLILTEKRTIDEKHQRALTRYYLDAGAGGIAVGVHTTQFAIREHGIFSPLLQLTSEEIDLFQQRKNVKIVKIAGVIGTTAQALKEAEIAAELGYDAVLLKLDKSSGSSLDELITHCRTIAGIIPLFGFYLQPALGGIYLPFNFWQRFMTEIDNVAAVKIATFNRYFSIDVVRALIETEREEEISLYTGNDDNIIADLLTPFVFSRRNKIVTVHIKGGLLGQWAVWTKSAVEILNRIKTVIKQGNSIPKELLTLNAELTDADGAIFDAVNNFKGTIPGVLEVLRREGLAEGTWCLNPNDKLSPGQADEITRVIKAYPHLTDDSFIRDNLSKWI